MNIHDFELAESPVGGPKPTDGWIPVAVPGGVHEALLAAGRIDDPYRDDNESLVRWIEDRDWWYRGVLEVPAGLEADERLRLVFHGLDTVVDLWLNNEPLGHHENMFRPAEFDVTGLSVGRHELTLRFTPPLAGLKPPTSATEMGARLEGAFSELAPEPGDSADEGTGMISEALPLATLRRKATFSWGWDFGPRIPSVGIWLPVELIRERRAAISGHHVRTETITADGTATVRILVEVDSFASQGNLTARVALTSPSGSTHTGHIPVHDGRGSSLLIIPDAELWWTHDLGAPSLYDTVIELLDGAAVIDRCEDRIGLRTIEIDRTPDPEGGRFFRFVLNGEAVFARGAAWLPPSMFVGSVTDEHLHEMVNLARHGGMTMLRIWGGGVYEHDAFYAACDELGVMVWQDFAFACIDYPSEDPVLAREVALEAQHQVRRLRNRASMAVWAGNNEVQLIHGFAYQGYEPGNWGYHFFHDLLPETVAAHDGGTPYWPGSPWGEDTSEGWMAVNGVLDGDRHAWEVWHGFDFGAGGGDFPSVGDARHYRRYALDRGKFISEFGIHAAPERATLERWVQPEALAIHSAAFDARNKDHPKDKHDAVLEIITGLPTTLDEYVDFTMVSQAEGLKYGIEHYRRRQPHCSGTLVWQFNDVWPGFSWSVIDYDLVPKAGFYAAKRAFSPLLASFKLDGDRLELWLSNAGRATSTRLMVGVRSFDGTSIAGDEVEAQIGAGESRVVWSAVDVTSTNHFASVSGDGIPENRLLFSEVRDVPFGASTLHWSAEWTDFGEVALTVTSSGYTFFAHVPSPVPGLRFDDNYFDLPDGKSRTIRITGLPAGMELSSLAPVGYAGQDVTVVYSA
jgi:beta-mannosidase